uniref:immunoglobulin domain-containing protein n=1 Tax=Odoribacter lunatus TaxID=2941335 RepID=UPI00203B7E2D
MKGIRFVLCAVVLFSGICGEVLGQVKEKYFGGSVDGFARSAVNFGVGVSATPSEVCEKERVVFTATLRAGDGGPYSFKWYQDGRFVSDSASFTKVSVGLADAGKYYCVVSNRSGQTVYSDTLTYVVHAIPTAVITAPAQNAKICYGDTLRLEGRSSVSGAAFSWKGPDLVGNTNSATAKAFPKADGKYELKVEADGCSAIDSVKVRVVHPTVDVPFVLNVAEGATVAITATDAGGTAISPATGLAWRTNLATAAGANVNPFSVNVVAGLETVYVSYTLEGCVVYDSVQLNTKGSGSFFGGINDGFARSSVNFGVKLVNFPMELCEGVDTALNMQVVCVDNPADYKVEWFKLSPAGSLGTTGRIVLSPLTLADSGSYYCRVTNKEGISVYSDTMHLTVNEVAVATIQLPAERVKMICWGDTLQVMGSSSVQGAKLKWYGTKIVGPDTAALTNVAPLVQTDYIFRADNRGCWTEDTLTVGINHPFVDIPFLQNVTEGSSLQLTAVDSAGNTLPPTGLSWRIKPSAFAGMNINPLTLPSVEKDMVVEVTLSANGCSATDSTIIQVKGAGSFHGGLQDGFTRTCLPPVILAQPYAGENQCVTAAKSLELKVVAEGTGIAYQWEKWDDRESCFKPFVPSHSGVTGENSPTLTFKTMQDRDNGMYRCVLNGQCGEELITDTCTVSVKGEPVILSGINVDRDMCAGSGAFEFNVIARNSAGTGTLQYRWYKNTLSNRISAEADTSLNYYKLNIGPTGAEEGLYIVEVSNACGSVYDSAYLPVIVPPKIVDQSVDVKACTGGEAEFWVKTNRDERYHYALYELTDYPSLATKRKIAESYMNKFVVSGVTKGGYYQIKVYHPFCDSTFSNDMVLHIEYPITVNGINSDTTLCTGESLTLKADASTQGTEPLSYRWFKDGVPLGSATNSNTWRLPYLTYERDTVYYYCEVSNTCGTVRSANAAVAVKRYPVIASGPELLPEYCEGDTLRASVVLVSKPSEVDSMRWFYQGKRLTDVAGHISGTTSLTLEIDSVRIGDGDGYYYLEVYNSCGLTRSMQVRFTLHELARFVKGLDGVRLLMCDGDKQMLAVEATGSQPIRYIWTQSGTIVADGYSNRLEVDASKVSKTETFICHIQNMCSKGGELTEAYVTTSRPDAFDFSGGGTYCERDGVGVEACLQGSDTSVLYHLYRQSGGEVAAIHGRDVLPLTGPLCFTGISGAGTYYVVAEDTNGCTAVMPGVAEVIEKPLPKDFSLVIRKQLCENTDSALVELMETELGVVYDLCEYNGTDWDTIRVAPWPWAGTGAPFVFQLTQGEYKVVARNVNTGCVRDLSGALTITEYAVPQVCDLSFWMNDSIYCRNAQSDVRLEQACFEGGCTYRLQKDGEDFGVPVTAAPVYWTGLEEGVYSVKVVNSWGCETEYGSKEVKAQDPPARYTLIGQAAYCEYDKDSSWIELGGSDLGVIYSFRYAPGFVYKEVAGTGGNIFLRVPLIERDYYVIARDTTREHCEIAMYDTVELRMSRLNVTAVSPVYVNYGDTTVLNITVTGAVGNVVYEWTPVDKLKDGEDVKEDPVTKAMTESTLFKVKVTDAAGCPVEKEVLVTVIGGDLAGGIADGEGHPVDTVQLCAGDMLDLNALVSGGACNGDYTYAWSDVNGPLAGGLKLSPVSPVNDTKIFLHVDCGNESLDDTVVVLVNPVVPVDTIEDAGMRCVAAGKPLTVQLNGSMASAYYYLQSSTDRVTWTDVTDLVGTGSVLSFVLPDASAYYGKYLRIVAQVPHKTADGGYCETKMVGELEVLQAPAEFNLSDGWAYCADSPVDSVIVMDGSEQQVTYYMVLLEEGVKFTKTGTGSALRFEPVTKPGNYVVQAALGRCITVMPDTVEVVENPVPGLDSLVGAGEYCKTECPVTVGIRGGQANVEYTLVSSNSGFVPLVWTGTGDHTFVTTLCDTGRYAVVAKDVQTGCRKEYGQVVLAEAPGELTVSGGGEFCADSTGLSSGVCVLSAQSGIFYGLYKVASGGNDFIDTLRLQQDGRACSLKKLEAGEYVVVGKVGQCERTMRDTVHVIRYELPGIGTLIGAGNHCIDSFVTIGITKAEDKVRYTLVCDNPGFTSVIRTGTDTLIFGNFSTIGTYRVEAYHTVTGCKAVYDSVVLAPAPQNVGVTGGGEFCPDSSNYLTTSVCIASPESGITYGLYVKGNQSTALGTFVTQADGSLCNRISLGKGDYVVIGKVGNCERVMEDTVKVLDKKLYDDNGKEVTLKFSGNGCVDSTVVLYIETAPAPYEFQLYHEGVAVGSVKQGTGGRLEWDISPAALGKWSVKTVVDGCKIELSAPVEIEHVPVLPELKGDTLYCAGNDVMLWVSGTESDVKYGLFRLPEDTLVMSGVLNGVRAEFSGVTAGTYYVQAERGSCKVSSTFLKVDSVALLALPLVETNDCVEAGKGEMQLSGLNKDYQYEISGPESRTIMNFETDTVLRSLMAGVYTVKVYDRESGCESEAAKDTIREGVPNDTLIPPFAYCKGEKMKLQLSGIHIGVTYKILTEGGSVLDTLVYSPRLSSQPFFAKEYEAGKYKFRVERTSFPAGCYREVLFEVVERNVPSSRIDVTLEGVAPVCDGNDYRVRLDKTSAGVLYVLQKQGPTVSLDTLIGTGSSSVFADTIRDAGSYIIRAVDSLAGCTTVLDTILTIHPLPEIWTGDCEYCVTEDSGCMIAVRGMDYGVLYRLNQLDTVTGPGGALFKKQPAGVYAVIAENMTTGCRNIDSVMITAKPGPNVYAMVPGCYSTEEVFDLQTTGSDTGVYYVLYCDGVEVSSNSVAGTGSALSFGLQTVTGVYRVKAIADNGCTVWMQDSVVVYHPLPAFEAEVTGSFCNGDTTGVMLSLKNAVKGWKYYVTNGFNLTSDTLYRPNGGVLAWNKLYNGTQPSSVLNGVYYFHALSPCGTDEEIGSLTVNGDTLPAKFQLVDKPQYYCAPEKFTLALSGSQAGVKYIVELYNSSGNLAQTYPAVIGDGVSNPFVLGEFDKPGYYKIIADNGCPLQLEFWEVKPGQLPELCPVIGDDVCRQSDADSLSVSVSCRENGVDYYLYRDVQPDGLLVDSLTSTWRPKPEMDFMKQSIIGCYYVMGVNASTGCQREMEGRICLNEPASIYHVEPVQALGDTLVICRGADTCIWLSGSEEGMGYELLRDGMSVNKVTGTGQRLKVGRITESGVYRVNAYVCGVMMEDSVVVKVLELPSLSLEPELRYCQGTLDSLRVLAFTSDALQYSCYRPSGSLLAQCNGMSDGSSFRFPAAVDEEGFYVVEVVDGNGCKYADSTQVIMEPYPDVFNITSSDGNYICRGSYVRLGLDGSEENVRYQLRLASPMEEVSEQEGTGSALTFPKQIKKAGTYYVTATYRTGLGCTVDFGSFTLQLADTILPFEVESVVNSYCATSSTPQGSLRLSGSQNGLIYYLTRDGKLLAETERTGDGGSLLWTGLEGKECNDTELVDGYIYRIIARDPVSGCERTMFGSDTIVAASPIRIIAREPNNVEIEKCEGSEMKFSVTTTGCRMTYKWLRNGLTLKNGKEPFYNIDSVQMLDYGVYECEITNSCGTVTSPEVTLMVRELVRLENPMPDEYVCDKSRTSVMFSSGFRNAETYTWYKLPDDVTEIGHRNFYELTNLQESDSGTYVVVANNRCGVEVRDTAKLIIGTNPSISISRVTVDTLCAGEYYATPYVTSATPFEWYLNGVKLGYTGPRYTIASVSAADEGNYFVEVTNACGKSVVPVSSLYVDDTLKVMNVSGPELIRCPSDGTVELSIDLAPVSDRTKYLWQDKNLNELGTESKLLVGPFAVNSYHTYRVWFTNKCSTGAHNFRDINVRVPDSIDVADPLRNVTLCADCTTDTVLRLGINRTMMVEYEWYYRETEEDGQGMLVSEADTISILNCTQNTGYYYCHYFNRCESKTTETSWVRIDTVPVVREVLWQDTLCEEMSLRVEVSATGGNLTYEWHILKNGRDSVFDTNLHVPQSSTDYGILPIVTMELDSALIWCHVYNTCGEDWSDTMLLRVFPKREVAMIPSVATICPGDSVSLQIILITGTPAWEYTIQFPDNREKTVRVASSRIDTLKVVQEGIYRIVSMKDVDGCILTSGLPEVEVRYKAASSLIMSGSQTVCYGDTARVRFSITGGVGPWKIHVVDILQSALAEELCGDSALVMTGRDTVIAFLAERSSEYSVQGFFDMGTGCNLALQDSTVIVNVGESGHINFSAGPWYVGQCHNVNLRNELKPMLNDTTALPSTGHFFIDGIDRGTSGVILKADLRGDSCYRVRC